MKTIVIISAMEVEAEYIEEDEGTYIVDGNMNLDDFFELINYDEEFETDYSTVGGFCQEILDRFVDALICNKSFDFQD